MPSRKEGFGIVFLEAAFFAKPSVGGAHGGTPEAIDDGETGWLVENGDDAQLSSVLTEALSNVDELHRRGLAAHRKLEQHYLFENFRANVAQLLGVPR